MARVILPASPHARGARPYVFVGDFAHDPVPGVKSWGGRIQAPVDAAWLFSGLPCVAGKPWPPGVPNVKAPHLYDFQQAGVDFLAWRDYAILADEMGLGKTVQALIAAEIRLQHAKTASRYYPHVLILCPAIAKNHWAREVQKWTGYQARILDGMRPDGAVPNGYRYIIANYDILYGQRRKDEAGKLQDREGLEGWGKVLADEQIPLVILDECHNLRGADSRCTKAVKEATRKSTVVWGLSGNPMPNHVRDFWAVGDIVTGGLLGKFWSWAKAYADAQKGEYGWITTGKSNLEELNRRLSFWVMGRAKSAVRAQLPDKRREVCVVDVARPPRPLEGMSTLPVTATKANMVAAALRETAKAKLPIIVEHTREALESRQKVIVFVYLRAQAEAVAVELTNFAKPAGFHTPWRVWAVSGDMTPEGRDAAATEFRAHDGPGVFVATLDSVGVAISLVGADLMIFGDLSYEAWKLLQGEGRAHRIGSEKSLLVRYLIARGTIDEEIQAVVIDKLATVEEALGGLADGRDLTAQLGRDMSSTQDIVDRLFAKLTGVK